MKEREQPQPYPKKKVNSYNIQQGYLFEGKETSRQLKWVWWRPNVTCTNDGIGALIKDKDRILDSEAVHQHVQGFQEYRLELDEQMVLVAEFCTEKEVR